MNRLVRALKARHAILETRVLEEQRRPKPDSIRLKALKKIKLQLRDQIASLERLIAQPAAAVTKRFPQKRQTLTS